MSKPFKLPGSFKIAQKEAHNEIIINQINPIWIVLYAIIFLACFFISLNIPVFAIGCVFTFVAAFYQLFIKAKYIISFDDETISVDNETVYFSEIKDIRISRKTSNVGFGVQTGSAEKVSIQIVTASECLTIGQHLIEEYQHALIFLLKKIVAKDLEFIAQHSTK
jgi:hypothetical protein